MADPFVAEIRIFPFNFAPRGWAWCDGQLLPLSQNTALFSLLGTTYGGDGKSQLRAARPAGPRADASRAGPGPVAARPRRDRRQRDRDAARERDPGALARGATRPQADGTERVARPGSCSPPASASRSTRRRQLDDHAVAERRRARRRRPAAQQPAAVPDVLLLHRAAGRLPAAGLMDGASTLRPVEPRRRGVPLPRLREHAGGGARGRAVGRGAEGGVPARAVRRPGPLVPRALRARDATTSSSSTASRPAACTSTAARPRSGSSTSRCCPSTAATGSGRAAAATSSPRPTRPASA